MVRRITVAARQVLVQDGYDQFSANRVATAAGISPGSLYQYFPNKQAILQLVLDHYWEQLAADVERSLIDHVDQFDVANARAVVDALLSALEADPVLLHIVVLDIPQASTQSQTTVLQRRVRELLAAVLRLHGAAEDREAATTKAWLVVTAIESLTSRWVLERPAIDRERFLDETVAFVNGYLLAGVSRPAPEGASTRTRNSV